MVKILQDSCQSVLCIRCLLRLTTYNLCSEGDGLCGVLQQTGQWSVSGIQLIISDMTTIGSTLLCYHIVSSCSRPFKMFSVDLKKKKVSTMFFFSVCVQGCNKSNDTACWIKQYTCRLSLNTLLWTQEISNTSSTHWVKPKPTEKKTISPWHKNLTKLQKRTSIPCFWSVYKKKKTCLGGVDVSILVLEVNYRKLHLTDVEQHEGCWVSGSSMWL